MSVEKAEIMDEILSEIKGLDSKFRTLEKGPRTAEEEEEYQYLGKKQVRLIKELQSER